MTVKHTTEHVDFLEIIDKCSAFNEHLVHNDLYHLKY